MSAGEYDFEVVILTSGGHGTPHAAALAASNPGLVIHVSDSLEPESETEWRNCDQNIRNWWLDHRAEVTTERVLFLEWDVLVSMDLREAFPVRKKPVGMEGARMMMLVHDGRSWPAFSEVNRLPEAVRPYACGIAPTAVVMLSRPALEMIADTRLDGIYEADIISELRLASLVRHAGFKVMGNPNLYQVECRVKTHPGADAAGIFHAIKTGGEA